MNIKKVVLDFEQAHMDLQTKLNNLRSHLTNEDKLWSEYEKLDDSYLLNPQVINFLCTGLQLADQKKHYELCNLNDLKYMYELLVKYYPDNIQYQEDLIAFVYNVLDDEIEALLLIDKLELKIQSTLDYLSRVKIEINDK
jgi:hypothetical protein